MAVTARELARFTLCAAASVWLLLGAILAPGAAASRTLPKQGQVVSIGILPFEDESGTDAPVELKRRVAEELQQKLNAASRNLLARPLNAGAGDSSVGAMNVEQLAALGKQQGVKFVVRGGLLEVRADSSGGEERWVIQLYADVITAETGAAGSVRAEGTGGQAGAPAAAGVRWDSINLARGELSNSAVGQALSSSLEQMAASIQQTVASPVAEEGTQQGTLDETAPAEAPAEDVAAAETDEELQQLIAQAEQFAASGAGSVEHLTALQNSLERLKAALASKAALLEQAQDTTQADAEVAARKEELQAAISALTQEVSDAGAGGTEVFETAEPTGEKKGVMSRINDFLGEALAILQKVQEIRAALRGADEESSYVATSPAEEGVGQGTIGEEVSVPTEEVPAEVEGTYAEEGESVAGVDVTEPESGESTTTDGDGTFRMPGLPGGKLTTLIFSKGGKQVGKVNVNLLRGRSTVVDFENSPYAKKGSAPVQRILPSTVLVSQSKARGVGAGTVKGVLRDAEGRPVPRALVSLKGLAMARTDSRGQYLFLNVPAGNHQLSVRKSGLRLKTQQVQVAAKQSGEVKTQFTAGDRASKAAGGRLLLARGSGTVLRGVVLDAAKVPLPGARVTALQPGGAVRVMSGPKGDFVMGGLKPGAYKILVYKVGYEGVAQSVTLRAGGAERRDFQLRRKPSPLVERVLAARRAHPARTGVRANSQRRGTTAPLLAADLKKGQLTGRVVDARTRRPIQGARVFVGRQQSVQTDQAGNFRVDNLLPGSQTVTIRKAGFLAQEKAFPVGADGPTRADFALEPASRGVDSGPLNRDTVTKVIAPAITSAARAGQLRGQVIDAKTGRPLPGAAVLVTGQQSAATDQYGNYVFNGLTPGTYQVSVRKSGFADGGGALSVRAGETTRANFRLNQRPSPVTRMRLPRM